MQVVSVAREKEKSVTHKCVILFLFCVLLFLLPPSLIQCFIATHTHAALSLLKPPDVHLSANTSGYETENDPTSIGLRNRTPPMKIRNLEDILKRLQHHIQHHQASSNASLGALDSISPALQMYDSGPLSSSMITGALLVNANGSSSMGTVGVGTNAGANGTGNSGGDGAGGSGSGGSGGSGSLPESNVTSPGAAGGAGTHLF